MLGAMPDFNTVNVTLSHDLRAGLPAWYGTYLGRLLARAEHEALDALPDLFGYHLVQLGGHGENLCENSRISVEIPRDNGPDPFSLFIY